MTRFLKGLAGAAFLLSTSGAQAQVQSVELRYLKACSGLSAVAKIQAVDEAIHQWALKLEFAEPAVAYYGNTCATYAQKRNSPDFISKRNRDQSVAYRAMSDVSRAEITARQQLQKLAPAADMLGEGPCSKEMKQKVQELEQSQTKLATEFSASTNKCAVDPPTP